MMIRRRDLACLPLLPLLANCAARRDSLSPNTPLLAPKLTLALTNPSTLGRDLSVYQLVTLQHGEQDHTFESHMQIKRNQFSLLITDMLGRRALQIIWNESGITSQPAAWLPPQLRPGSMLADIVTLYWPEHSLRLALAGTNAILIDTLRERSILLDGQRLAHAEYDFDPMKNWTGHVRYANQAWGYRLDIQTEEITA